MAPVVFKRGFVHRTVVVSASHSTALAKAGLKVNGRVEASEGKVTFSISTTQQYELDELLAQCPARKVLLSEEDKQWLEAEPVGREAW